MASQTTSKQHFHSIDTLRGLAALAVCFFHFTDGFLQPDNWFRIINHYGYLGVDAFFVISGFVIPYSFSLKNYEIREYWSFFKKRFVRIEPAYWASIGLMLFKDTLSSFLTDYRYFKFPPYDPLSIGLHFIHANDFFNKSWIINPYWTLAIDWQFYLFIGVIFFLVKRPEWWARYAVYIFFIGIKWYFNEDMKAWLFYHSLSFLPGIVFFHYKKGYIGKVEMYIVWLISLFFIQYKIGWNHAIAIALSCIIIEFVTGDWKATSFLGKISYSMYLTHIFSGWWFCVLLVMVFPDEWMKNLVIVAGVLVSIIFAKIFYDKIESPTQEWARKV